MPKTGTSGIYKIKNNITGDTYIGQSRNIEARWEEHVRYSQIPLYKQFNEYGIENFEFTVLEETDDNLLNKERGYIFREQPTLNGLNGRLYREKARVRKPVMQCDPETGDPIVEFESQTAAEKATGVPQPQISACVNGRQPTAGGFIWKSVL